jgi:hypothetical protein
MVDAVLRTSPRGLFLGDNGGRLARAPTPALLREARRLGVPILPGSDPLPFPDHQTRAGSFGFISDAMLDESQPAQGLRAWLRGLGTQPPTYGALERFGAFCWNQARMQWRKRVIRSG